MNSFSIEYQSTKLWMNAVAYSGRSRWPAEATDVFLTSTTAKACDGRLALTLTQTLHRRSGGQERGHTRSSQRGLPAGCAMRMGLAGKASQGGIHGFYAYSRRLRLGHAEALEDVKRLPEKYPRGIGAPGAERRFRDPFEDLGLLVGVANLPGELEDGMVLVERLAVAARGAAHVGDPAERD